MGSLLVHCGRLERNCTPASTRLRAAGYRSPSLLQSLREVEGPMLAEPELSLLVDEEGSAFRTGLGTTCVAPVSVVDVGVGSIRGGGSTTQSRPSLPSPLFHNATTTVKFGGERHLHGW